MRLIDAEALEYHKQLECMGNGQYEDVKVVYECDIDNAPTIDAVEVVRCKECKHWNEEDHWCNIRDSYGWDYTPDDYCSYGERKEE